MQHLYRPVRAAGAPLLRATWTRRGHNRGSSVRTTEDVLAVALRLTLARPRASRLTLLATPSAPSCTGIAAAATVVLSSPADSCGFVSVAGTFLTPRRPLCADRLSVR